MNTMVLSLLPVLRRLSGRDQWTREQLERHQANSLRELRTHVYEHSPFYREFHKGLFDTPLQELPVLTKAQMLERFDDLVTDRSIHLADVRTHMAKLVSDEQFLRRYWVVCSSGSSGMPGYFLYNRSEWVTVLASVGRPHGWAGLKIGPPHRVKEAVITSTVPWHMTSRLGWSVSSWWVPTLRLDATLPIATIVERLNAWQPAVLQVYATVARTLADEQMAGRLRIAPKLVFCTSEVLTYDTRQRIAAAWGRQPFDQYASSETGSAAAECEQHRGLHLSEDLVIFEVVDENNRPVPPGAFGEKVLITVLYNRTQPLIRYALNDSICLATEPCPCGRPYSLVNSIQGRIEDILYLPAANGGQVNVHPNTIDAVMDLVPLTGWQVVQEVEGLRVLVSGIRDETAGKTIERALQQALVACGAIVPPIRVEQVSAIPRGTSGKAALIKCNLPRESPSPLPA